MKEEIRKFLDTKKLTYREDSNDFQLDCFMCSDKKQRLGISYKTGSWQCMKGTCGKSGKKLKSLSYAWNHKSDIKSEKDNEEEKKATIKKDLHRTHHKRIFKTKTYDSARYVIEHRGLSKEVIRHFKLGCKSKFKKKDGGSYNAGEHLAIPYIVDGDCVNVKYRALDPEADLKWQREKGGVSALFNQDVINDLDYDWIAITESEIDAMSLWHLGIKNVVGLTVGAKGFKQDWYDKLKRYKRIYLVLDNDEVGREGSESLARRLGLGKCFNVTLPDDVKDPNDYIAKYDLVHFKKLLKQAKRFKVRGARNLRNMMERSIQKKFYEEKEDEKEFYSTPWKRVNSVIGPLRPGHLFVLCGKPKSGKSTLAVNLMDHWGNQKINTAMYSCEMNEMSIADKFTMMKCRTAESIEEITKADVHQAMAKLPLDRMNFYYPERRELKGDLESVEGVMLKIEEMVQRYGINIFIFDNLHFLCRGENEKTLLDTATQQFKLLAEELNILIILVAHPRKTNNNKQLTTDDMKGSSSLFQDADLVWLMFRKAIDGNVTPDEMDGKVEGSMSERADISVTGRWTEGGNTFLAFDGKHSNFKDKGIKFKKLVEELKKSKKRKSRGL